MNNIDQLLTVILVIRDRPFYTDRWMHYANATRFPFNILIADGGNDLFVQNKLENQVHYPHLKYNYIRYPYDVSTKEYFCKIADALEKTKTPYVVLADDDDFWNIDGLRASILFLEKNSDYATCRGRNFAFTQTQKNQLKIHFDPHTIFDISDTLPTDRVMKIYPILGGTFYDVHRTENYTKIFKQVADINMHFLPLCETMISLMDAAMGKIKRLEIPYLLRECGHNQSTSQQDHLSRLIFGPIHENLLAICHAIANEIALNQSIDIPAFELKLKNEFVKQIAPRLSNHLYAYHQISFSEIMRDFKTWLIHNIERKYTRTGKNTRLLTNWLHRKKIKKKFKAYQRKNEEPIFQEIDQFLAQYENR